MRIILAITALYFLAGAVLIAVINQRKKDEERFTRWVKYGFYLLVVAATLAAIWYKWFDVLSYVICSAALMELVWVALKNKSTRPINYLFAAAVFGLMGFSLVVFARDADSQKQLFLYTLVFSFDGFSQLTGQLLGSKKLVQAVSPGKTLEGFAGGMLFTVITGILLRDLIGATISEAVLLSVIIAVFALAGDLMASLYKRWHGVKDYNNLIPGHGGFLDRYDSLLGAAAAITLAGF